MVLGFEGPVVRSWNRYQEGHGDDRRAEDDHDADHERGDQHGAPRGARPPRAGDADRSGHRPVRGTFGVTRGLFEDYGEERIRDAPLCESGTVGYAIGLAVTGVRAVCEIEFFDFVGVAMDQIFNQAAKLTTSRAASSRCPS